MSSRRLARVNELLREEIGELLLHAMRDPRLSGLISVTEVITSGDLRHAKVYVSVLGTEDDKKGAEEALKAAAGFLRRSLAERVTLRYIPDLSFEIDESIERGSRLLQIIKEVVPEQESSD
ncbi:MAG: 30S ribosome-binding factor RbfA [Dehalococcoidia bacterium]|nr:30S ribosome-binding factor RbfA [Dehalococcoidia bacterium]